MEWENEESQDDAVQENAEEVIDHEPEDGDNEIVGNQNTGPSPHTSPVAATRTDVPESSRGSGRQKNKTTNKIKRLCHWKSI